MSVLVTGGAGYVGSHVVAALLDAGRDVVIADDFRLGSRDALERIASATQGRRPRVLEVDVANEAHLERALKGERVDAVVQVASLLPAAASSVRRATGDVPFVFSSSARVYGVPWRCPVEEHDACAPVTPEGIAAFESERVLQAASAAAGGSPLAILRYFHAAGAHASGWLGEEASGPAHDLMSRLELVAAGALPALVVHGCDYPTRDGTAVRDYVHVDDIAEAHVRALAVLEKGRPSFVVNLGSARGHTVREVVRAFETASGRRITVVPGSRRDGDVAELWAHGHAAEILGWQPARSIVRMCEDTLRWRHASLARQRAMRRQATVNAEPLAL